jgi:antitoxin component YwqK of YwqJK toxin-antitoxin module
MLNDEYTGKWIVRYDTGQLKTKGKYENGLAEGKWVFYHPNGVKAAKGKYLHDKRTNFKYYNLEGKPIADPNLNTKPAEP